MAAWLVERGVLPGAELLDAGCGTGRYATELARRGYVVHGIDRSPELIDVARQSVGDARSVSFAVGDILGNQPVATMPFSVAAFSTTSSRMTSVQPCSRRSRGRFGLRACSSWTCESGRRQRCAKIESRSSERASRPTGASSLLQASPRSTERTRRLLLSERHTLVDDGQERSSDYQFVMRCWTREELESSLARAASAKLPTSVHTTRR